MIKLIKSSFYNEELTKEALCKFISNAEYLSMDEQCRSFETEFSAWQEREFSVLFNSGSSANLALIQALLNIGSLKKGDNCGFSGITWATNVMPLIQLGLNAIPIDISMRTLNISLEEVQKIHENSNLKCLFVTNLLGFSDDLEAIRNYCDIHNILLLEDNCESLGSVLGGVKLGNFSTASTFSFFVGHHMSTIEGGMVCTDDVDIYEELLKVRSHGWDRHLNETATKKIRTKYNITDFYAKYTFYDLAYNLRPTEITGFLGRFQLKYLDEMIKIRQENFNRLKKLYENSDFVTIDVSHMETVSNFAIPIVCKSSRLHKEMIRRAEKGGVEVRPIVGGVMSDQPFFAKYYESKYELPNSRFANENGFYFGNNPELTDKEIETLVGVFQP